MFTDSIRCSYCGRLYSLASFTTTAFQYKRCKSCDQTFRNEAGQMRQTLYAAYESEGVTAKLVDTLFDRIKQIALPRDIGIEVVHIAERLELLSQIRIGNIPVIHLNMHLDSDEIPHLDTPATYYKPNKQVRLIKGSLRATNKALYFVTPEGNDGMKIPVGNIAEVAYGGEISTFRLVLTRGKGGGTYQVHDREYAKEVIDAIVKLWKRQLVMVQGTSRYIPDVIKAAVYKRDGGRCVQCGYVGDYLQYDHIVPFSLGGPTTVANIQLLCGKCNQKKGNRI